MRQFTEEAIQTESRDFHAIANRISTQREIRLLHAAMGLCSESGELMDVMNKYLFYGKPIDISNVKEEAGDAMWYLAILFSELGCGFEDIGCMIINKLRIRYPDKFTEFDAQHRDLEAEREIVNAISPVPPVAIENDPKRFLTCPVGHTRSFTHSGIGLYTCHDCGPYLFGREQGKPVWIEPEKVPIGLRKKAADKPKVE